MATLQATRCFLHEEREAAARCPECECFYCRECVTEHKGRVICSGCLAEAAPKKVGRSAVIGKILMPFKIVAAFILLWLIFFCVGVWLQDLPSEFHDGVFESAKGSP